jgi:hypothetical protein
MSTNGRRNKIAGSGWERTLAQMFRDIGFTDVITTRQGSRELDALKIDLMNSNTSKEGRLAYNIQAKNIRGHIPYAKVIAELPIEENITNVICHKMTRKVGNRFVEQDQFAILYLDDFMNMVKRLREYESKTAQKV